VQRAPSAAGRGPPAGPSDPLVRGREAAAALVFALIRFAGFPRFPQVPDPSRAADREPAGSHGGDPGSAASV